MSKRFTDTSKWNKPFIRGLQAPYKLLWLYILDECDHAGIWQVDFEVAKIKTGEDINIETAKESFKNKIKIFDNEEKWFIQDFIEFQYGTLNPGNRAHNSVLNILSKYKIKPLVSSLQGGKDMDKDMDSNNKKESPVYFENLKLNSVFVDLLDSRKKLKKPATDKAIELLIKTLNKFPDDEYRIKSIEKSIKSGWQDVFELKDEPVKTIATTYTTPPPFVIK